MRYIGNKESLLDTIYSKISSHGISGAKFFDFFSGTTNVARYFKDKGYQVESCDLLYLSFCLQKAYIENNAEPTFDKLLPKLKVKTTSLFSSPLELVIEHLNSVKDEFGFISQHYTPLGTQDLPQPRMYFSEENGLRIDAVRITVEKWKRHSLITDTEYYILLACLIESVSFYANVAGVYAAFHKKWDPRAVKRFYLRPIKIHNNGLNNRAYNTNSLELVPSIDTDIIYMDPPYNERQYLPNYHIIETIARYDNPPIKGITGMRPYSKEKSTFCNAASAIRDLEYVAANAKYKHLVLSYNSEGIMSTESIFLILSKFGKVSLEEIEYLRFKSNNNGVSSRKKHVYEQIFILSK
ncbi:MAG: DNA adenine methylase [Prevotella sp.]|nr:DNA adenine methylase [Prevotella sp.]MCM1074442.1 DNA adenine methylase [Ruminococcus sp.]